LLHATLLLYYKTKGMSIPFLKKLKYFLMFFLKKSIDNKFFL